MEISKHDLNKQVDLHSGARLSLGKESVERLWSSSCGHRQASSPRIVFVSATSPANT